MVDIGAIMTGLAEFPLVQILAMEYDSPYINETILFCYCSCLITEIMMTTKTYHLANLLALSLLRCFGGFGIMLPLMLGRLPNRALESCDTYILLLVVAMFWVGFVVNNFVPRFLHKYIDFANRFSFGIIKANALGHAFAMTVQAIPNTVVTPFVGGFIGVCGDRLLEFGTDICNHELDADYQFGLYGGLVFFVCIQYLGFPAVLGRIMLLIFHVSLSLGYVDILIEKMKGAYEKVVGRKKPAPKTSPMKSSKSVVSSSNMKSSMKRGRSKTPGKK